MSVGEGKGKWAAIEAAHMAVSNPLFDAPLEGATGILLNVKGGKGLALGQVHEVAEIIRKASKADADVVFGIVRDRKLGSRVNITLVATRIVRARDEADGPEAVAGGASEPGVELVESARDLPTNGHRAADAVESRRLL